MKHEIKRYVPCWFSRTMNRVDNGGWVKFKDHKAIVESMQVKEFDEKAAREFAEEFTDFHMMTRVDCMLAMARFMFNQLTQGGGK